MEITLRIYQLISQEMKCAMTHLENIH